MRDIASMYGAPSPSLVSRDPVGLDPRDDYTSQLEPSGSRPDDDEDDDDDDEYDEQEEAVSAPPPTPPVLGGPKAAHNNPNIISNSPMAAPPLVGHTGGALKCLSDNVVEAAAAAVDDDAINVEIAKLVGLPPPPPRAPPPKKQPRSRNKTSKAAAAAAVETVSSFKENEVVDDEVAAGGAFAIWTESSNGAATPTTSGVRGSSPAKAFNNTEPLRERPSPSAQKQQQRNIVEERRQIALSMYESSGLLLDHESRPIMATSLPPPVVIPFAADPMVVVHSSNEMPLSPTVRTGHNRSIHRKQAGSSPSSEVTKPHSNQTQDPLEARSPNRVVVHLKPPSPVRKATSNTVEVMNNNKPEVKRRGFSLERNNRGSSVERNRSRPNSKERTRKSSPTPRPDVSSRREKKDKRGFFKKLFGGGGRSSRDNSPTARNVNVDDMATYDNVSVAGAVAVQISTPTHSVSSQKTAAAEEVPTSTPPVTVPEFWGEAERNVEPQIEWPASFANEFAELKEQPLKPALKSQEDRHYQGAPIVAFVNETSTVSPARRTESLRVAHNDHPDDEGRDSHAGYQSDRVMQSTSNLSQGSMKLKSFSQDPPDDEHGDPPIYTGPPLLSPSNHHLTLPSSLEEESEQIRMDSVRSRIAEMYEGHFHPDLHPTVDGFPANISNDRSDPFFPQTDDVSILTGPSFESLNKKKSFDPSPRNEKDESEDTPQQERVPDMFGPILAPARTINLLRVQVQGPTMDPAGASPAVRSARDLHPDRHPLGDPLGESPMAWQIPKYSSNDPLGSSPFNAAQITMTPSQRALSLLSDDDMVEILHVSQDIPDPPLMDGYASDDSAMIAEEEKKEDMDESYFTSMTNTTAEEEKKEEEMTMIKKTVDMIDSVLVDNLNAEISWEKVKDKPVQIHSVSEADMLSTMRRESEHDKQHLDTSESLPGQKTSRDEVDRVVAAAVIINPPNKIALETQPVKEANVMTPPRRRQKFSDRKSPIPRTPSRGGNTDKNDALQVAGPSSSETAPDCGTEIDEPINMSKELALGTGKVDSSPLRSEQASSSEIEKSGFKSAPSSPSTALKKTLTISTAAFTNAKAVAYLHRLHGKPSPRHTWHAAKQRKGDAIPVPEKPIHQPLLAKASKRNGKKKKGYVSSKKKSPSPEEYCATNVEVEEMIKSLAHDEHLTKLESTPQDSDAKGVVSSDHPTKNYVRNDPTKIFVPYSRFRGRKPTRNVAPSPEMLDNKRGVAPVPETLSPDAILKRSLEKIVPLGKISGLAVVRGIELRRLKREDDIENGRSKRAIVTPRKKPTGGNRFNFVPADESEIKDPIRRAGRRLLSKAAVPIQSGARRFLAKREAIDRMWAVIQIQCYIRRWRCETNLQAHIHSATVAQATFRGWRSREKLKDMHFCATLIQKIMRGYLAAVHAYDTIYYICRVQALMRGCCVRLENERKHDAASTIQTSFRDYYERKENAATSIQKMYRGHSVYKALKGIPHVVRTQALFRGYKARQEFSVARASIGTIQSVWRSYSARMTFQMVIVDILIVQSIARRWAARRRVNLIRHSVYTSAVTRFQATWRCFKAYITFKKFVAARRIQTAWRRYEARTNHHRFLSARDIQASWRCHTARVQHRRYIAARKIQSMWRGFQSYTDYIFMIVDVLVVQRMVRQWLAVRKAKQLRMDKFATRIQSVWRRHKAQVKLLYSLVHIIVVQSCARRYLSRFSVEERKKVAAKRSLVLTKKAEAATVVQKTWRGFWSYSHFIIVQYEIARIQALIRGKLARETFNLKLGCAILIQAASRGFLAKTSMKKIVINRADVASAAQGLRQRNSAKRIQFWWRIVLDWTKEKNAALTIERFFVFVKAEVDREIRRRERKSLSKEKKRKKKHRESEDQLLEKVWLNTVDESSTIASIISSAPAAKTVQNANRSKSAPRQRDPPVHVHQTPPMDINPRMQVASIYGRSPPESVQLAPSGDFSVVSNITNPSVFHRMPSAHQLKGTRQASDEASRRDLRARSNNDRSRLTTEDYIRKYSGMQTAPHRMFKSAEEQSFFSEDDGSTASSKMRRQSSTGTPTTYTQSHTQATTPVGERGRRSAKRRGSSGAPISISVAPSTPRGGLDIDSPRVPSTPRSNSSSSNYRSMSTPRAHSGSNRDSFPKYPPVTPTREKTSSISHRGTVETESQTTMSETTYMRASPRIHSTVQGRGKSSVMIMKTFPDLRDGESVAEAHEILLLGDDYGEV